MRRVAVTAVSLILLASSWALSSVFGMQRSAGLPTATHVGVVVPDIEAALRSYADVFGIPVPEVQPVQIPLPDGSREPTKRAVVPMPGFHIEVLEPEGTSGPIAEHLAAFGISAHQIGFAVEGNLEEVRDAMIAKGGTLSAVQDGLFAYVDFRERLGLTIEIQPSDRNPNSPATVGRQTGLFGGLPVRHVALAVRDVEDAIEGFADVLGLTPTEPILFPPQPGPFPFPPGLWNVNSKVRAAMLQLANIGLELIQPVGGPSPWTDTLDKQRGNAIQHLSVGRGEMDRETWLRIGQEKGGRWTNGGSNGEFGGFAYLDFTETLGLIFE